MEVEDPNTYVAELLRQLEELKRKKARRIQKLKKLGRTTTKETQRPAKDKNKCTIDVSCSSIENIPQHTVLSGEKQNNSEIKCHKCGYHLNSKNDLCMQCTRVECKEDKSVIDIVSSNVPLKMESKNCEDKIISQHKNVNKNRNLKSSIKGNDTQQNLCLSSMKELQSDNSDYDATFSQSKEIPNSLNVAIETFENSHESLRKQRKRSSTIEDGTVENAEYDSKRFKSDDTIPNRNRQCDSSARHGYSLKENEVFFPKTECLPSYSEEKPEMTNTGSEDEIDESLTHNMTCFLSSSLLIGDENVGDTTNKSSSVNQMSINQIGTIQDLGSTSTCINDVPFLHSPKQSKHLNNKCGDASKVISSCSEKTSSQSILEEQSEKLKGLYIQDECFQSQNTSDLLEEVGIKVSQPFAGTCIPKSSCGLEITSAKDFQHSDVKHALGSKFSSALDAHYGSPVKASTALQKMDDLKQSTKNAKSCLSDIKCKMNDVELKVCEESPKDLPSSFQMDDDLKMSDLSSFENSNGVDVCAETEVQIIDLAEQEEIEDNFTPSLLDSSFDQQAKCMNNNTTTSIVDELKSVTADKCDKTELLNDLCENVLDTGDDVLTADINFNSTSLEVADTLDDLLIESCSKYDNFKLSSDKHTVISDTAFNVPNSEVFTIPETECFDTSCHSAVQTYLKTKSKNNDNNKVNKGEQKEAGNSLRYGPNPELMKQSIKCSEYGAPVNEQQVFSSALISNNFVKLDYEPFTDSQFDSLDQLQTVQDTPLLNVEDSSDLGSYKNIPFLEKEIMTNSSLDLEELPEDEDTNMKFVCCLHSDIVEPVTDVKFVFFNKNNYAFIQHLTWIQVWRKEGNEDWIRIFSHQVDDKVQLKEICFSKDDKHLILVMLLCSEQAHCLQFLLFEKEARVIKLMEHTHWLQNRYPEENVLLCGLGDLRFATAQGKDSFEVFVHVFSSLEDNPKLMTAALGSTAGQLHSLCKIEKLPNALLGTSESMLYVWHLLEARLVTSVLLQSPDLLSIESCIWATIENGLVFLMTICSDKDSSQVCQLLAVNLATGFCQIAMTYSFRPSADGETITNKNLKAVYNEPFLAASCKQGSFLWSATNEYCCAALNKDADVTAIAIGNHSQDIFIVAVGCSAGCVNCYNLECS